MKIPTALKFDQKHCSALSRIFSPVVLDSIANTGGSTYLTEVFKKCGLVGQLPISTPFTTFLELIYNFLIKHYRNEYVYKNAIANKILLGKHSLKTAQMLTEFRAGTCKADVVILNGSATVYEIKSEYDSFKRLEKQIGEYLKVFDQINVITSESQVVKLKSLLPREIGIQVLTRRHTIKTVRKSNSNLGNINAEVLFDSLRKNEYLTVIKDYYGSIPKLPNTLLFKACKELYCRIPLETMYDHTVRVLRNRGNNALLKDYLQQIPLSLTAYALGIGSKERNFEQFTSLLEKRLDQCLSPGVI
jgi:hypothetical protein